MVSRSFVPLLAAFALVCFVMPAAADFTTLWPQPQSVTNGSTTGTLTPGAFSIIISMDAPCAAYSYPVLDEAIDRYQKLIFWYSSNANAADVAADVLRSNANANAAAVSINTLEICVLDTTEVLQFPVNETYSISVDASGNAQLTGATQWAALLGLETFSQLVEYNDSTNVYSVSGLPLVVQDTPRFSWRGLLVDSARHFLSLSAIYRTIDAMTFSKLNVLHWHIVDAQSFPLELSSYPMLSKAGAYHTSATYSADDVANVVSYAYQRGVRVLPEFDTPGHSASWGFYYPVTSNCPALASNINNINLSPASNLTLELLQGVLNEAGGMFPDNFMHIGGDEVVQSCWSQDPQVAAWMKKNGMTTLQVYQYFVQHGSQFVSAMNKTAVHWQEVVDNKLNVPKTDIIEVWDGDDMANVVSQGYQTIMAAGYYLDQQIPNSDMTFYEWEDTWKDFYANDPIIGQGLSPSQYNLVLGGEAAMWGEQITAVNIDERIWPRACATAERLWSSSSLTSASAATPRLAAHSCRLARRGIASGPVQPDFCLLPPNSPWN